MKTLKTFGYKIYLIMNIPSLFLHEFSHFFVGLLLSSLGKNVKIYKKYKIPAFVTMDFSTNSRRIAIISASPILINVLLSILIITNITNAFGIILLICSTISIRTLLPSKIDIQNIKNYNKDWENEF